MASNLRIALRRRDSVRRSYRSSFWSSGMAWQRHATSSRTFESPVGFGDVAHVSEAGWLGFRGFGTGLWLFVNALSIDVNRFITLFKFRKSPCFRFPKRSSISSEDG